MAIIFGNEYIILDGFNCAANITDMNSNNRSFLCKIFLTKIKLRNANFTKTQMKEEKRNEKFTRKIFVVEMFVETEDLIEHRCVNVKLLETNQEIDDEFPLSKTKSLPFSNEIAFDNKSMVATLHSFHSVGEI